MRPETNKPRAGINLFALGWFVRNVANMLQICAVCWIPSQGSIQEGEGGYNLLLPLPQQELRNRDERSNQVFFFLVNLGQHPKYPSPRTKIPDYAPTLNFLDIEKKNFSKFV